MKKVTKIMIKDLPPHIGDSINRDIMDYSIALIGLANESGETKAYLLGSGTLVELNDIKGILTAYHVIDSKNWRRSRKIGFAIAKFDHNFAIEKDYLFASKVFFVKSELKDRRQRLCPDIAFIQLPLSDIHTFMTYKLFWNINLNKSRIDRNIDAIRDNVWAISGVPAQVVRVCWTVWRLS